MDTKQLFVETWVDEMPRFEKVLKAIPKRNLKYRPDKKSRTALELATLIAVEPVVLKEILKTGKYDFSDWPKKSFSSGSAAAAAFKKGATALKDLATKMDDAQWEADSVLTGAGQPWTVPRGKMAWGFLLDLIHHRGQLSTYLRPMGGKVPAIYGPSADSQS
ncbi:MAG TPA: DinB family protein [Acidobacteriota bacterium]